MHSRRFHVSAALLAGLVVGSLGCDDGPNNNTGGAGGTGGMMCVPVEDNNECTDDVCQADGTTGHNPKAVGTACTKGGTQCDGQGKCVECLAAQDCPGTDDACQTRTCTSGKCGKDFAAADTVLATQTKGDCKVAVCDGNGAITQNNDDADINDDKNACTTDACEMGMPTNTKLAQGTNCGTNSAGNPLVCNAMGQCVGCNLAADCPGVDDECSKRTCLSGVCGTSFTPKNTPVMTQTPNDCQKQVCDGAGKFTSIADNADRPIDDNNVCTVEACVNGMPSQTNASTGTACNDGNKCTLVDTCQAGVCKGATPVMCVPLDQCHVAGTCNPTTGLCDSPAKPDGATCNDGNGCTQTDTCQTGTCMGANFKTCTASDSCHDAGTCNPTTGACSNPPKPNGVACSDNNACTQVDTCQAGNCVGTNSITCTASDQCHAVGTCNPMTGVCSDPPKPNGTPCNDNSLCSAADVCQAGVCKGLTNVTCFASDQCHVAGTCNAMTGICDNPAAPNGTMCSLAGGASGVCATGSCVLCGNGTINAGEQCDDGNTTDGDGCDASCKIQEIEANNACMMANAITLSGMPASGTISGAIMPVGDQDWYSFTIPGTNPRSVRIETFVGGIGSCGATFGSNDTQISLYKSDCSTLLGSDDEDGLDACSLIDPTVDAFARNVSPGTYYVKMNRFNDLDVINQYQLQVTLLSTCGNGTIESGEFCDDGNTSLGDGCNGQCGVEAGFFCSGTTTSICVPAEVNCSDGIDNNGNGAMDGADPSCAVPAYFTSCSGGQRLLVYPITGPIAIPNAPAMLTSNVNVTSTGLVSRAALAFSIEHPYASDVDISLTPPGGMALNMSTGNGAFGDNFTNTLLDSTCSPNISTVTNANAPFSACYAPETSLATLNGTSANGMWRLSVSDNFPTSDDGTLNNWKLILCTSP